MIAFGRKLCEGYPPDHGIAAALFRLERLPLTQSNAAGWPCVLYHLGFIPLTFVWAKTFGVDD